MALFSRKPEDPLEQQLRRLEDEKRALEQQVERLQHRMGHPEPAKKPPQPVEVIPPDDSKTSPAPARPRPLGVHHRRARRRALTILGILLVLALVIWRVVQG